MAYLVKPFEKADLLPAVEMAVSRFAEVVALESEVADLRDRLEARTRHRPRQGRAPVPARAHRAGGLPLDPADLDGLPPDDARARAGRDRRHRRPRPPSRRRRADRSGHDLATAVRDRAPGTRALSYGPISPTDRCARAVRSPTSLEMVHGPVLAHPAPARPDRCGHPRTRRLRRRVRHQRARGDLVELRPRAATSSSSAPAANSGDGTLTIGSLLPQTGNLAFLGPPEFAGVELAIKEINEAGGVLGKDVEYVEGDSGDTQQDVANPTVDRLLQAKVDAIIGAASSGVSFSVIDKITSAGVVHYSPANTSPDFTDVRRQGPVLPHRALRRAPGPRARRDDRRRRLQQRRHPRAAGPVRRGPGQERRRHGHRRGRRARAGGAGLLRPGRHQLRRPDRPGEVGQPRRHRAHRLRGVGQGHPGHGRAGHRPAGRPAVPGRRQPEQLARRRPAQGRPRGRQGHAARRVGSRRLPQARPDRRRQPRRVPLHGGVLRRGHHHRARRHRRQVRRGHRDRRGAAGGHPQRREVRDLRGVRRAGRGRHRLRLRRRQRPDRVLRRR